MPNNIHPEYPTIDATAPEQISQTLYYGLQERYERLGNLLSNVPRDSDHQRYLRFERRCVRDAARSLNFNVKHL